MVLAAGLGPDRVCELTRRLADSTDGATVVVTGVPDDPAVLMSCIEAGARGYVTRDGSLQDVVGAVRRAGRREADVSGSMAYWLMGRVAELVRLCEGSGIEPGLLARLTQRELQVLSLLGEHLSNAEISARLVIEPGTVKTHVHNLLAKLEVARRQEAVAYLTVAGRPSGDGRGPAGSDGGRRRGSREAAPGG